MNFKLGPHNSLSEISSEWNFEIDTNSKDLEKEMIEFMISNNGIGLAANQIGITKRVFVMGSYNIEGFPTPFALFNPKIIEYSKEQVLDKEGCLSYPGLWLKINRSAIIRVEYQDSSGNTHESAMSGLIARCFLHELDHLNGICFVDKVSSLKLQLGMRKLRKHK
jgi:peptide deformylase